MLSSGLANDINFIVFYTLGYYIPLIYDTCFNCYYMVVKVVHHSRIIANHLQIFDAICKIMAPN